MKTHTHLTCNRQIIRLVFLFFFLLSSSFSFSQRKMENVNRGLVAISTGGSNVYLSWRLLGDEAFDIGFNIYRNGTKITPTPITTKTNYLDTAGATSATYYVKPVVGGVEQTASETASVWTSAMQRVNLNIPAGGTTPDTVAYTYTANDCSVGDLDGDGEYEIILKWDPTNSKDNSQPGYTGNVYLDAYKMDGTQLWRIDLGMNIRAGAHYTQFIVYDLDSDGKAEVACRTAPNSKDGTGAYLSNGPAASDNNTLDYRNGTGYNLTSPEYLTVFNGETGAEMSTISFEPARGASVNTWGDGYGNRADRFLAGVAYLDGVNPSLIMGRGYYQPQVGYEAKSSVAAFDFNGTTLSNKWVFWANTATNLNEAYIGQGTHSLAIADVDQDGFDEVIYGSMTIDHDGSGLYSTEFGHGDALHVSDLDPDRPGLEIFEPHEEFELPYGISFRDAKTGAVIWGFDADYDVGRGVSADLNPDYKGYESWASGYGMYSCKGALITNNLPTSTSGSVSINHIVWWDGDLLGEILDRNVLNKYDYTDGSTDRLWTLYNEGVSTNNGTKDNPALTADIFGDWREEIIMRTSDNSQLVIFNTTVESSHKIYCLMHDPVYRCAIAWQNVGYNQPPHVGYYLGADMDTPVKPDIQLVGEVVNVLDIPTNVTATASDNSITVDWTAVTGATGYVVNVCDVPSGGGGGDVNAYLSSDSDQGGYYILSSGDYTHTSVSVGNEAISCSPAGVTATVYRTASINDHVLELVTTDDVSAIKIGGRSSGTTSNRNLLSYSINGGAAQTAGIGGLITAQGCTTEITLTGLSLHIGDEIAFTFDGNVQLSYYILTISGATPVCTEYIVSGGATSSEIITGLTSETAYTYQVKSVDGILAEESAYSAAQTITTLAVVNDPTIDEPVNKTQSVLDGTAITAIVYTWGGGATDLSVTGLPIGLTASKNVGAKTLTISGTPTVDGTYTVSTIGGTGLSVDVSGDITVLPGVTCLALVEILIEDVAVGGNYTLSLYDAAGIIEIKVLSEGYFSAGDSNFLFPRNVFASGTYSFKLLSGVSAVKTGTVIIP